MSLNDLVQWICVAVILVIVAVKVVRYIRGIAKRAVDARGRRDVPGGCCGKISGGNEPLEKKPAYKNPRQTGNPCAGCGEECPLSGYCGKAPGEDQKL